MRTMIILALALTACDGGSGETDDTDVPTTLTAVCEQPTEVACFDDMLLDLGLHEEVAAGAVSGTAEGNDWIMEVDGTAGGFNNAANNPWVYVRFTDSGPEKVAIDDVQALDSMEWHLAAHRFKLRLNGGSSGPSCVSGAALFDKTYDDVTLDDADGATFFEDDFYTPSCDFINDSSGLEGSPQVAMGPWWSYDTCVATTATPFILRLDSGRMLKFVVQRYYGTGQQACNNTGAAGGESGMYTMKWAFLN